MGLKTIPVSVHREYDVALYGLPGEIETLSLHDGKEHYQPTSADVTGHELLAAGVTHLVHFTSGGCGRLAVPGYFRSGSV